MEASSLEFKICPNCGSTEYIQDYPVKGKQICTRCGHHNAAIELKVVERWWKILDNCPFCGCARAKEGEEDETLYEKNDTMIFKCKECGKLDGYLYLPRDFSEPARDGSYDSLSVKIAEKEGKLVHPVSKYREFAEVIRKREKSSVEKCKKQLDRLLNEKTPEMKAAGISTETINAATRKVVDFLKDKLVTNRQLISLLSAAIYETSHEELVRLSAARQVVKKISERQLESIFGITRKTIRKWKKCLTRREHNPCL